jgi:hypothetical protein
MKTRHHIFINVLAAGVAAILIAPVAEATDVYLRAEAFTKSIPMDSAGSVQDVTMWGYSSCDAAFTTCAAPASPGPEITVPAGDSTLTIHLQNMLADEATSIMIPGQTKGMVPQPFVDDQSRTRFRAFDVEAAAGGGTQLYTWDNLRPGTYLYQSASHVQLQVQMGLYGAMTHDFAAASITTTPVAVANPGFEAPDCSAAGGVCIANPAGNYTAGAATGWTGPATIGIFRPISVITPTEGAQVGYSNGGTLAQVLGESPAANATYTLTVDVGDRSDTGFPGYTVALYSGATLLASTSGAAGSVTSGWTTATVTYVAGPTPPVNPLEIRLTSAGGQTEFDKVELSRSAVGAGPCGGAACAYDGAGYDRATTVVFSEVDPLLHDPAPKAANATVDGYLPRFFLVNGAPFIRPLAVANAGFETPDCDTTTCTVSPLGSYTTGTATGWTITGGSGGVYDPIGVITPTEGDQVGWSSGATLSQVLSDTLAANVNYTLSVDVGDRTDTGFPGYTVALYAGGTLLASNVGAAGSVTSGWTTATVTYTSGSTPPSGPIEIRLTSAGSQTEFDNVRLTTTTQLAAAAPGERVLLRLVNAGLQSRAPQLLGGYFEIVGEDGHRAPVARTQYNTLLPAGKSLDVIFTPTATGRYPLYDRRLGLTNGKGQLGHIVVGP